MSTLFPKPIQYESHTANSTEGEYVDGVYVKGDTELLTFYGSVQPASGKEIDSLSVGREDTGKVKIYSDRILPVSKEDGTDTGAIVYWEDEKWEVIYDGKFQNSLIPHYKYIAQYYGKISDEAEL